MEKKDFIQQIEFLYHLTSRENSKIILENRTIESAVEVLNNSNINSQERIDILRTRRVGHLFVENKKGQTIMIRDQNPISIKSLAKCLTEGWNTGDFIYHLNNRVFFWPNLNRLRIHYSKYQNENPVIIKCRTEDILELNNNVKLCHLNSGATRCHPKWGGAPPPRGSNSFVDIENFDQGFRRIAEVTFERSCNLPRNLWTALNSEGPWVKR